MSKAGWSWGCVSAIDSNGRALWIAAARLGVMKHPRAGRLLPRYPSISRRGAHERNDVPI